MSSSGLEQWVNDQLHLAIGLSDRYIAQFLINLAHKSISSQSFLDKIEATGTISINKSVKEFAKQLWSKVPHAERKEKPARLHEQKIIETLEKNRSYKLLADDDDDDQPQPQPAKRAHVEASKSKNRHLRERLEVSSDSEPESVESNEAKTREESEDEFDKMENDRLQDLKERDEFANRLKKKDREHTRNIVERSDKKAFEEAAKRLRLEAEDKKKIVPKLRVESRRKYLEKRKEDKLAELEGDIVDDEYLFSEISVTKRERSELEYKKKVLQLAKEHERAREMEKVQRYHMPEETRDKNVNETYIEVDEKERVPNAEQRKWEEA